MGIQEKLTVNLSADQVGEIVKEHLEAKGYRITKVTPKLQESGDDRFGPTYQTFAGIDCEGTKE